MAYSLGIDFGTNSVRAVIVDLKEGTEVSSAICAYPSGLDGVILDEKNPHLARQNPMDYHIAMATVVKKALAGAPKGAREQVIGIGVDTTGSTPLPVDEHLVPLSFHREFRTNKNSMAWLWKDHTGSDEAEEITALAGKIRPQYLASIGGVYSSEWFFSKILHLARTDRKVFNASAGFIECADYIPAVLAGIRDPKEVKRSICAAGHKAMYAAAWKGLPDEEFLSKLDRSFAGLRDRLYRKAWPAGVPAGRLCGEWAKKFGLPEGIPISVGAFDAHMGAVGAGVGPGRLVKILGTSTCDMMVFPTDADLPAIPGLCGVVPDSILPGYYGLEAGQSAVGDIFYWFVRKFMPEKGGDAYQYYQKKAAHFKPGETGLLALDWQNGNRTVLVDQKLTGLIMGFTLNTRPEEVYRALVEATAFGARAIIERLREYGVGVKEIINCGGLAEKNPLLMQIYADITGAALKIAASSQTCAVGAAIFGAVAAGKTAGGFADAEEAQKIFCRFKKTVYRPDAKRKAVYDDLFALYRDLHDAFGTKGYRKNLFHVMKRLLEIKEKAG